jgi:methylenetetrahydrofolate--tRNA-(uracil-5-)-methyltransferase
VAQLRQDNKLGTLFNMVGFQTKLKHGEQLRIFRSIPGLEQAEFARLGGLHRNTFLNAPKVLDERLRLKSDPRLRFAGQITGVEGYVESAAMGLLAGRLAAAERSGERFLLPPPETAHGALVNHITGGHIETTDQPTRSFQPMNINFGLFPPVTLPRTADGRRLRGKERQLARKRAYTSRAISSFTGWLTQTPMAAE